MTYKELQAKAKELGLKSVGVSKKDLKESIKNFGKGNSPEPSTPSNKGDVPTKKNEVKKEVKGINVAVISSKDGREVRRYTLEQHGEDFKDIAGKYAEFHDYKVELIKVGKGIECPKCGHIFQPKTAIVE